MLKIKREKSHNLDRLRNEVCELEKQIDLKLTERMLKPNCTQFEVSKYAELRSEFAAVSTSLASVLEKQASVLAQNNALKEELAEKVLYRVLPLTAQMNFLENGLKGTSMTESTEEIIFAKRKNAG